MLTPEQQAKREGKITASFVPALMAGKLAEINNKYLELIGDPEWKPLIDEDDWAPAWGAYGEPFILDWHERKTGHAITRRGEFVQHPTKEFVGCTLDGFREFDKTAIDAKVCTAWTPVDEHLAFYTPQVIVQRACLQCPHGALLMVHGNSKPTEYPIFVHPEYEATLWQRIDQFKYCVDNFIPPVEMAFPRIVPPEQWRTVDLDKDGAQFNWALDMKAVLEIWDRNKDHADAFKAAVDSVKKILPDDIGTLVCAGVVIKRARNNAVTIRRAK